MGAQKKFGNLIHSYYATMQRSTDELEEFRRQWKAEVEIKKHVEHAHVEAPANTDNFHKNEHSAEATHSSSTAGLVQHVTEPESSETQIEEEVIEKKSAMDYYMLAVDKERQGNLGHGKLGCFEYGIW
jgi:hypothetical protein